MINHSKLFVCENLEDRAISNLKYMYEVKKNTFFSG